MKRISSARELLQLNEQIQKGLELEKDKIKVKVHLSTCGLSSGAGQVYEAFEKEIAARKLPNVILQKASCIGLCGEEPVVTVTGSTKDPIIYHDVDSNLVVRIINEHIVDNKPVSEFIVDTSVPRFKLQERRIMRNQDLDPMKIEDYISRGGYLALARALSSMKPEQVLKEVENAGLKGRGGAGFPAATKWQFVRNSRADEKYIVCNGDEGDPGAYMNRAVLEGNPHSIIEGMTLGAYAIGNVKQGFAYVRAEYPLAIKTLQTAIDVAREYGLLGDNILGSDLSFDLEIFPGAGAFVCGEETALLTSIEGKRGNPRQRPPFPAASGLFGKPTTLNNVETLSNVPQIILNGADWFTQVGNDVARGTKTLCLVGKLNHTGLVEVPLGITLKEVIFDIGGGIPNGKKFKAVQIGGPSGGVIPVQHLYTPVDYSSITKLGAIMGSGGVVVMDEDSCMVDVARYFLDFTREESCGKCISCRVGNDKMYDILTKITQGKATMDDLKILEDLTSIVPAASICGLGTTAANPVLTTLRYFRDEYEEHIIDKKCRAAVCQSLFTAPCRHTCPVGLDIPGYVSLIDEGKYELAYKLIMQYLPLPLSIGRICTHPCEQRCLRGQIDSPVAIRHLKRFAADYVYKHGIEYRPRVNKSKKDRVAVIGAGPAGLACAWDLTVEGYPVTVFESLPVAGGLLATGIPEYRLPKHILNYEIDNFRKLGVNIQLNSSVDDIGKLQAEGYKAILIASGAYKSRKIGIEGEDMPGVTNAIQYLRAVNLGKKPYTGKKVVVVGGGNSAIDSARVALRSGAREVSIVYRRQQEDMPAEASEIEAALEGGIKIHYMAVPNRVIARDGKLAGIECLKARPGNFDLSGRREPIPLKGSEFNVDCDTVIVAVGQKLDNSFLGDSYFDTTKDGKIVVDKRTQLASNRGVFAAGDCAIGQEIAIEAIASGQRAACSINRYLRGEKLSPLISRNIPETVPVSRVMPPEENSKMRARIKINEVPVRQRKPSTEIVLSYNKDEACAEAGRCLRCDLVEGGLGFIRRRQLNIATIEGESE